MAPEATSRTKTRDPSAQSSTREHRDPGADAGREAPPQRSEAEKVAAVDELLSGKPDKAKPARQEARQTAAEEDAGGEEADDGSAAPEPAEGRSGPKTIKELAEALAVEPEKIYDLEVSTGDGETIKLGELKDAWQDRQKSARETAQRESRLDEREAAILAEQRIWAQLAGDLSGKVSPQVMQAIKARAEHTDLVERQRMLAAMPELNDRSAFEAWRGDVVRFLDGYGYRPQEMAITDHRMLVILRDHMRLKSRLDKLLAYEPDQEPPAAARPIGRGETPSRTKALMERARRSGKEADKVAAVDGLIRGR